jgi:peptidoglycan hydrolase-like protein with peptidoglycan-binding domain
VVRDRFRIALRLAVLLATCAVGLTPAAAQASSVRLGSRTLRQGMTGHDVKALQTDLALVGLKTPATGYFGAATERSVRSFERINDLVVNGIVNAQFVKLLRKQLPTANGSGSGGVGLTVGKQSTNTDPTDTPTVIKQNGGSQHLGERTLRPGMRGHDVRVLQGYLTLAGFPANVDGAFGPATKASVVRFQLAHGMKANGIVTYPETLVLRKAVSTALAGGRVGKATIAPDGKAIAPSGAPAVVKRVIAAANRIIDTSYCYAGGHGSWNSSCYDCSGAVSYALHGGGLLSAPLAVEFEGYGSPGPGKWITVYANSAHVFVVIAGRAFDTADFGGPNIPAGTGPRWRSDPTGNLADGGDYVVRHPSGL